MIPDLETAAKGLSTAIEFVLVPALAAWFTSALVPQKDPSISTSKKRRVVTLLGTFLLAFVASMVGNLLRSRSGGKPSLILGENLTVNVADHGHLIKLSFDGLLVSGAEKVRVTDISGSVTDQEAMQPTVTHFATNDFLCKENGVLIRLPFQLPESGAVHVNCEATTHVSREQLGRVVDGEQHEFSITIDTARGERLEAKYCFLFDQALRAQMMHDASLQRRIIDAHC